MSLSITYQTNYSTALSSLIALDVVLSTIIFLGALFVLMKNEKLPKWHVTPLWYIGITSLLSVLSVIFEYLFGKDFALSYFNVGSYLDIATKAFVAWIAITFFVVTAVRCAKGEKKPVRKKSLIK